MSDIPTLEEEVKRLSAATDSARENEVPKLIELGTELLRAGKPEEAYSHFSRAYVLGDDSSQDRVLETIAVRDKMALPNEHWYRLLCSEFSEYSGFRIIKGTIDEGDDATPMEYARIGHTKENGESSESLHFDFHQYKEGGAHVTKINGSRFHKYRSGLSHSMPCHIKFVNTSLEVVEVDDYSDVFSPIRRGMLVRDAIKTIKEKYIKFRG